MYIMLNTGCIRFPGCRTGYRRPVLRALAPCLGWLALLLGSQAGAMPATAGITFSPSDGKVLQQVVVRLADDHYRQMKLDDALSERFLQSLLDRLDPDRHFFLQSDIAAFEVYRYRLDDLSRQGNLEPAARILTAYKARVGDRLRHEIAALPGRLAGYDFQVDEQHQADRSQARWATRPDELDELWRKAIKAMAVDLLVAGKSMADIESLLQKRLQNQLDRLERLNHTDFLDIYTNTLAELYDPHTSYLSPARSQQFAISMSLSLEGIGASLQADNQYTRVMSLVPGGPAEKQGQLQPSDRIVGVGQGDEPVREVIGWRLDDVVALIRGPKGSVVRLEVIPASAASEAERKVIRIVRDKVKLEDQAASGEVLEVGPQGRKVGVIKLPTFYVDYEARQRGDSSYRSTTRDVGRLIRQLDKAGAEGLVIDLRNNGGGDLKEATDLTSLFIDYGPIVQIRMSSDYVTRQSKSSLDNSPVYKKPVVVLVNRLSASASEIFAGALQDYGRALVVGSRTFGKGTVQTLTELDEGQLKITVSKFYRISGGSTQHKGVEPDIALPSVYDETELGESSHKTALAWDSIHSIRHPVYYPVQQVLPALAGISGQRTAADPDFRFIRDSLQVQADLDKGTIELHIDKRRSQLNHWRELALNLENARRKAKGLPAYDKSVFDAVGEDGDTALPAAEPAANGKKDPVQALYADMYIMEAGQVLLDFQDALVASGFGSDQLANRRH